MSLATCYNLDGLREAGCDEAGRGCLAGPVFAASVIFPVGYTNSQLNDSKKLTEKQRYTLREIVERDSLAFAIGVVSAAEIDKINILNASFLAMHKALEQLTQLPEFILIDGNRFKPWNEIPYQCIVKGDGKYISIAAASILAKTYRDDYMLKIDSEFPEYKWKSNKGYPTVDHRRAILKYGMTKHHRKTFNVQLNLFD